MSDQFFVYILYCPVTGKSYVGQTNHLLLRFYEHRDGKSRWSKQLKQPIIAPTPGTLAEP